MKTVQSFLIKLNIKSPSEAAISFLVCIEYPKQSLKEAFTFSLILVANMQEKPGCALPCEWVKKMQ